MQQPKTKFERIILTVFVILSSFNIHSFAQNVGIGSDSIVFGNQIKIVDNSTFNFIGRKGSSVYVIQPSGFKPVFFHLDGNMNPIARIEFPLKDQKISYHLKGIYLGDDMRVITHRYNTTSKMREVYYTLLDINTLEEKSSRQKWFEFKVNLDGVEGSEAFTDLIMGEEYLILDSPDKKKRVAVIPHSNKDDQDELEIIYFDETLKEVDRKSFPLEIGSRSITFAHLSNEGNLTIAFHKEILDDKTRHAGYSTSFYTISSKGEFIDLADNLDKKNLISVRTTLDSEGNYRAFGLYSDNLDQIPEGIVHIAFNFKTGAVEYSTTTAFSPELEAENYNWVLRNTIVLPSGEIIAMMEDSYKLSYRTGSISDGSYTVTNQHEGNIIAAKVDHEGKIVWISKIRKLQRIENSSEERYTSSYSFCQNGYLNIVFNDQAKNYETGQFLYEKHWGYTSKSVLVNCQLDIETGELVNRKIIAADEEIKLLPEARLAWFDSTSQQLYLPATKGTTLQFGKINFTSMQK